MVCPSTRGAILDFPAITAFDLDSFFLSLPTTSSQNEFFIRGCVLASPLFVFPSAVRTMTYALVPLFPPSLIIRSFFLSLLFSFSRWCEQRLLTLPALLRLFWRGRSEELAIRPVFLSRCKSLPRGRGFPFRVPMTPQVALFSLKASFITRSSVAFGVRSLLSATA